MDVISDVNKSGLIAIFRDDAKEIAIEMVAHRRHLHQHPELSFAEHQTSKYVADQLSKLDVKFTRGWCKDHGAAGIVAEVRGADPDCRHFALRADLDALPILETPGRPYGSKNKGAMHACGHDAHTACLLGAAALLQRNRAHWNGTVRLLFQPGEERLPGGASLMVAEGALDTIPDLQARSAPSGIAAQHVYPELPAGKVGFCSGAYMAATDEIYIRISAPGGHGALPQGSADPILAAAHTVVALQSIVARMRDPLSPGVLTIGQITGGQAGNIIPDRVMLAGTLRSYDETWRQRAHSDIERVIQSTCEAYGAEVEIQIDHGYPTVVNDPSLTAACRQLAVDLLGADHVVDLPQRMTGEDFSFYQKEIPGCFYRLGTSGADPQTHNGLHTPGFDVDESALITGAALLALIGASA
jgi:amidohydrolase